MAACSQRRLWELLQEQQQPFVLSVYLLERRLELNNNQEQPSSRRKVSYARKIFKLLLYKFISTSHTKQVPNCHHGTQKHALLNCRTTKTEPSNGETRGLPVVSNSVELHFSLTSACPQSRASCLPKISQTVIESRFKEQEAAADRNLHWGKKEENERLSPSSALHSVTSSNKVSHFQAQEEHASTSSTMTSRKSEEDSIFSVFLRALMIRPLIENHFGLTEQQDIYSPCFPQQLKSKRFLQVQKQLVFDCVHEAIETQGRKIRRRKQAKAQEFKSLHDLGKIISEQIKLWCKQNAGQKISFDTNSIVEDWDYLQPLKRKICTEIGEAILNDIIQDTIINSNNI